MSHNYHRSAPPASRFAIPVLLLAAMIAICGTMQLASQKNQQAHLAVAIEEATQRIAANEADIENIRMRKAQLMNRYIMRLQLQKMGAQMQTIPGGAIEVVSDPAKPLANRPADLRP